MEDEKRIVIRVDPETWQKYDDKRHAERTSFQQLGERLLEQWLGGTTAVPESEQTLTCPHCESTLYIGPDNVTKVVVPGDKLVSERAELSPAAGVLSGFASVNKRERRALELLLKILRSQKPGLPSAITYNLEQFSDAAELYAEHEGRAATTQAGTDEPGKAEGLSRYVDDFEQLARDNRELRENLEKAKEALRQALLKVAEGERRHHGRSVKGSKG